MSISREPSTRIVHTERVMGTVFSFDVRGSGAASDAIDEAVARLHALDARFSTYRSDSEVARWGRGQLTDDARSPQLRDVVEECERIATRSHGAFSGWFGTGYDPSAYVKGWSADRAGEVLRSYGCGTWAINAGGDVLVASAPDAPNTWRIGVRHPFDPSAIATLLDARDLAVATSGRYERGDHIVDPRTGLPVASVASVTVCGPSLGLADAYATAAFVLAEDGPAWVGGIDGYECWSVLADGRVLATAGFPRVVHGVPVVVKPRSRSAESSL